MSQPPVAPATASPGPGHPGAGTARRVLVVDDEQALATLVASYLERDGFEVAVAFDGVSAVEVARLLDPDVVVLDLGLPGQDGLEVCRQLRTFSDCYVVMLTARADEVDMLIGLAVGADDYLTKPFSPRELTARIHTLLRRPRGRAGPSAATATGAADIPGRRVFGDLVIDPQAREITLAGRPITVTRTEFDLVDALSERPRMVFSRRQLIDRVWGETWVGDEHLVDIHLGHVRRKLGEDPAGPRYVLTVRGVGYRMGTG